jgi:hypothetical protein
VNNNRRKFLKIVLIGGSSFIVGKVLGPLFSDFFDGSTAKNDPVAFKVVGDKKTFSVYDDTGEEVLQIDNSV